MLRSGKRSSYYLDKYRFETDPDLLRALGERLAEVVREAEPELRRLAGPALGAVALTASASMASGLPFIIVRGETKGYGTGEQGSRTYDAGEVCVGEDVTSGGALAESVAALREAGLVVRAAVCVVDREEGDPTRSHGPACASGLSTVRPTGSASGRREPAWLSQIRWPGTVPAAVRTPRRPGGYGSDQAGFR